MLAASMFLTNFWISFSVFSTPEMIDSSVIRSDAYKAAPVSDRMRDWNAEASDGSKSLARLSPASRRRSCNGARLVARLRVVWASAAIDRRISREAKSKKTSLSVLNVSLPSIRLTETDVETGNEDHTRSAAAGGFWNRFFAS